MKQHILFFIFLMTISSVIAVNLAINCSQETIFCNENTPSITINYNLSNVKLEDKLDGIAVRIDYDNSLLTFSSISKNKKEFIESKGAAALPFGVIVDNNTIDTGLFIIGDCFKQKTCPVGNGSSLAIEFSCKKEGKINCSSFKIIDTKDLNSKTWWSNGDFENDGKKKAFENNTAVKEKKILKKENILLKPIKLILSWFF